MNYKSIILTLLIAAFFLACGTKKKTGLTKKQASSYFLKMEKTVCFGTCPVYSVILKGDAKAEFNGVRHVEKMGSFLSTLPDTTFRSIVKMSKNAEWDTYDAEYMTGYSDLPSTILTYSIEAGDTTRVRMESDAGPADLQALAEKLEDYRKTGKWVSINLD